MGGQIQQDPSASRSRSPPSELQHPLFLPKHQCNAPPRVTCKARKSRGCENNTGETNRAANGLLLQHVMELHFSKTQRKNKRLRGQSPVCNLRGKIPWDCARTTAKSSISPATAGLSLCTEEDNQLSFFH